jgi:hypothetical protein
MSLVRLFEDSAAAHKTSADLLAALGKQSAARAARERAERSRERAERYRAALSGEGNGSRSGEGAGELGEDRQIGV